MLFPFSVCVTADLHYMHNQNNIEQQTEGRSSFENKLPFINLDMKDFRKCETTSFHWGKRVIFNRKFLIYFNYVIM